MLNTPNGLKGKFDNNTIIKAFDTPPVLAFDSKDNLTDVNLDGCYIISKDKVKNVVEENGVIRSIELK